MRDVLLGNTSITTTAFGFGCTGLMRPDSEAERIAPLAAAWEGGIRHFDVARYYGYGGAEGVLGKFLATGGRRDQATITTKFGLEPPSAGQGSGGWSLLRLARRAASVHPAVRSVLARFAKGTVRAGRFDVAGAQRNLDTSLRELRTDRIDLWLLHEATLADTRTPGLLAFLERAKREGKIRAFGLGTEFINVPPILAEAPEFGAVVQIANGFGHRNLARLPVDPGRAVLTHGALKNLPALEAALSRTPGQFGSLRGSMLAGWLLGLSRHENLGGVTLFSSLQPARVRANLAALESTAALTAEDWQAFTSEAGKGLGSAPYVR